MCGIVGLFLKDPALEPRLGALLAEMLGVMTDRGPDSAGFAVYGGGKAGYSKFTLRAATAEALATLPKALAAGLGAKVEAHSHDTHMVVSLPSAEEGAARAWLAEHRPDVSVVGSGKRMEIYKEVGLPAEVAERFELAAMTGTHGVGHTRMATESAVTTRGAHPFTTGPDQCLVHNGSLSNHNSVRRTLKAKGLTFETENDSEVAAGYLTDKMQDGASLREALEGGLVDLDGFFTFVVGTENGFAVVRDPIACKPAVMAETDQYVAFGSEYRALVGLPGIENARMFEPEPGRVYAWERV
jgi:glutamate synthase domain-containing protein 1